MDKICPYHRTYKLQILCTDESCTAYRMLCIKCTISTKIKSKHLGHKLITIGDLINDFERSKSDRAALKIVKRQASQGDDLFNQKLPQCSAKEYLKLLKVYKLLQLPTARSRPKKFKSSLNSEAAGFVPKMLSQSREANEGLQRILKPLDLNNLRSEEIPLHRKISGFNSPAPNSNAKNSEAAIHPIERSLMRDKMSILKKFGTLSDQKTSMTPTQKTICDLFRSSATKKKLTPRFSGLDWYRKQELGHPVLMTMNSNSEESNTKLVEGNLGMDAKLLGKPKRLNFEIALDPTDKCPSHEKILAIKKLHKMMKITENGRKQDILNCNDPSSTTALKDGRMQWKHESAKLFREKPEVGPYNFSLKEENNNKMELNGFKEFLRFSLKNRTGTRKVKDAKEKWKKFTSYEKNYWKSFAYIRNIERQEMVEIEHNPASENCSGDPIKKLKL